MDIEPGKAEHLTERAAPSPPSTVISASYQFTGPIPSPQDLARYEATVPGLAERLITRYERQSDHRMEMERAVITSSIARSARGLTVGFVVALASILTSAFVIVHGHDVAGTVLGGGTLVGLVGTFVYGTNSRRNERLEREKLLTDPSMTPPE